jgi:hypothetical protein
MVDNPEAGPTPGKEITIGDAVRAPIIYFDNAPTCGYGNGIINVMLAAGLARISHTTGCIGAANQRKLLCSNNLARLAERPDADRVYSGFFWI